MTTTYRNPWHRPLDKAYGPPVYQTEARPAEYRGYQIFHRLSEVWDVVKDGVCVTQRAGADGARRAVDALLTPARPLKRKDKVRYRYDGPVRSLAGQIGYVVGWDRNGWVKVKFADEVVKCAEANLSRITA